MPARSLETLLADGETEETLRNALYEARQLSSNNPVWQARVNDLRVELAFELENITRKQGSLF